LLDSTVSGDLEIAVVSPGNTPGVLH